MSTPAATFQRAVLAPPGWTVVWQTAVDAERLAPDRWPDTYGIPAVCTVTPGRMEEFRCLTLSVPPEWAALCQAVGESARRVNVSQRLELATAVAARLGHNALRALQRLDRVAYRKAIDAVLLELP